MSTNLRYTCKEGIFKTYSCPLCGILNSPNLILINTSQNPKYGIYIEEIKLPSKITLL